MSANRTTMVELIEADTFRDQDLNCAETMLHAADRAYNLKLSRDALKLASGFGGGMGIESSCGALTGGVMALSTLFVRERAHEGDRIKLLTSEFLEKSQHEMGSIDCVDIKKSYRDPVVNCKAAILIAARILSEIIDRELVLSR